MKKLQVWLPLLFAIIMILGMLIGYHLYPDIGSAGFFKTSKRVPVQQVIDLVNQKYVDSVNSDSLSDEAIEGMHQARDPARPERHRRSHHCCRYRSRRHLRRSRPAPLSLAHRGRHRGRHRRPARHLARAHRARTRHLPEHRGTHLVAQPIPNNTTNASRQPARPSTTNTGEANVVNQLRCPGMTITSDAEPHSLTYRLR